MKTGWRNSHDEGKERRAAEKRAYFGSSLESSSARKSCGILPRRYSDPVIVATAAGVSRWRQDPPRAQVL